MRKYVVIFDLKDQTLIGHAFITARDKKDAREEFMKKNIQYSKIKKIEIYYK